MTILISIHFNPNELNITPGKLWRTLQVSCVLCTGIRDHLLRLLLINNMVPLSMSRFFNHFFKPISIHHIQLICRRWEIIFRTNISVLGRKIIFTTYWLKNRSNHPIFHNGKSVNQRPTFKDSNLIIRNRERSTQVAGRCSNLRELMKSTMNGKDRKLHTVGAEWSNHYEVYFSVSKTIPLLLKSTIFVLLSNDSHVLHC